MDFTFHTRNIEITHSLSEIFAETKVKPLAQETVMTEQVPTRDKQ